MLFEIDIKEIIAIGGGSGILTLLSKEFIVYVFRKNRNGKLSKEQHDELCTAKLAPIIQHQKRSDQQFERLHDKIDKLKDTLIEKIGELKNVQSKH